MVINQKQKQNTTKTDVSVCITGKSSTKVLLDDKASFVNFERKTEQQKVMFLMLFKSFRKSDKAANVIDSLLKTKKKLSVRHRIKALNIILLYNVLPLKWVYFFNTHHDAEHNNAVQI